MSSRFSVSLTCALNVGGALDLTRCISALRISKTGRAMAGIWLRSPMANSALEAILKETKHSVQGLTIFAR